METSQQTEFTLTDTLAETQMPDIFDDLDSYIQTWGQSTHLAKPIVDEVETRRLGRPFKVPNVDTRVTGRL